MTLGDLRNLLQINESAAGIGKALNEDCARLIVNLILEGRNVLGIGPAHMPIEVLEGGAKLVHRTAIELTRGDEVAARLHERVEDEKLSRMAGRSEEHTSELQSRENLVCRLLLEKKKQRQAR